MKRINIEYLNGTKEDVDVFQMIEVHRSKDNVKYIVLDGVAYRLSSINRVYLNKGKYNSLLNDLGNIANRIKSGDYYMYLNLND